MEIWELQESLQDAIANDSDINNFCNNKYSKLPKVYLGIDERNPPAKEEYPIITIFNIDRADRGETEQFISYEVLIGVGIIQESIEKTGQKIIYLGAKEVEKLRSLVELAIFKARIGHKLDVDGKTASDMIFPLFRSDTVIRIQFLKSQRGPIN